MNQFDKIYNNFLIKNVLKILFIPISTLYKIVTLCTVIFVDYIFNHNGYKLLLKYTSYKRFFNLHKYGKTHVNNVDYRHHQYRKH